MSPKYRVSHKRVANIYQNPQFAQKSASRAEQKAQEKEQAVPVPAALIIPEPPPLSADGGIIASKKIIEASGMTRSGYRSDVLWVINDEEGDNRGRLHAVGSDGSDLGSLGIVGTHTYDWEDLGLLNWNGQPHLVVADIGDNQANRNSLILYVVREPTVIPGRKIAPTISLAWRIRFRFEDGARDCEALAIDPSSRKAYLISKRKKDVGVYRLSIDPAEGGAWRVRRVARRVATLAVVPSGAEALDDFSSLMRNMALGNQVTALDFSLDGQRAAVLTYSRILLFEKAGKSWERAFLDAPVALAYPPLYQAESLCFSQDGKALYLCSEGLNSPLHRVDLP